MVYLESDLVNVAMATMDQNEKLKQLEEIMTFLIMRVNNSQGAVQPPVSSLLNILNSTQF